VAVFLKFERDGRLKILKKVIKSRMGLWSIELGWWAGQLQSSLENCILVPGFHFLKIHNFGVSWVTLRNFQNLG
jgi:hypothetical protein